MKQPTIWNNTWQECFTFVPETDFTYIIAFVRYRTNTHTFEFSVLSSILIVFFPLDYLSHLCRQYSLRKICASSCGFRYRKVRTESKDTYAHTFYLYALSEKMPFKGLQHICCTSYHIQYMRGPKTDEKSVWVQISLRKEQKCNPTEWRTEM